MPKKRPPSPKSRTPLGWCIGSSYFVRGVNNYIVGRLVSIDANELIFEDASWIAYTGRFYQALTTGTFDEIEPFPHPVIVGRGSLCDATLWPFDLPRSQK